MKTYTVIKYSYDELSEDAKKKARDAYRDLIADDPYPLDEIVGSLKAMLKAAGVDLVDWSIGAYNRNNYVRIEMGDAGELTGRRAFAWLEHNLFGPLRMTRADVNNLWKKYKICGGGYAVGAIKPCPFTGVCYDDEFIAHVMDAVRDGEDLRDAFRGLADRAGAMAEAESEARNEDSEVEDAIRANGYEFLENGRMG